MRGNRLDLLHQVLVLEGLVVEGDGRYLWFEDLVDQDQDQDKDPIFAPRLSAATISMIAIPRPSRCR